MTRRNLTVKLLDAVTSNGKAQQDHFDALCPGLSIRVTKAKKKTWNFLFTSPRDGRIARISLGTYPAIGLDDARRLAEQARKKVQTGKDPRDEENEAPPKTIAQLIEERIDLGLKGKRSADRTKWRFEKYVTPLVGKVAVADFRIDPHYNRVIDPLLKANRLRTAGTVFQDLRALMNFAIQRGVIEYSKIARVKRPDTANARTRFLSDDEIVTVWRGLKSALPRSDHIPAILRLCLLTGQRLSEVAGLRREEIDVGARVWTIPGERSKNKHSHAVPLSEPALQLVREALRTSNGDYLFPDRSGEGPTVHTVVDYALSKAQLARVGMPLGKFGIPRWTPHDLRRTVATGMSRLNIGQIIIGHVLNHRTTTKSTLTQQVYDQYDFAREKREALETWSNHISGIVGGPLVEAKSETVPVLRRKAGAS